MLRVLEHWGAPKEKIEYESKREVVWLYTDKQVSFSEGKVKSWKTKDGKSVDANSLASEKAEVAKKQIEPEKESDYVVEEILDELLKQTPSKSKSK